MIKVKLMKNIRVFNDYDTDLAISTGEVKILKDRDLQANSLKLAFFKGELEITEGEFIARIKKALVIFSAKEPKKCYAIDKVQGEEKYFERDLVTLDFTYYKDKNDMPEYFRNKLEGKEELNDLEVKEKIFEKIEGTGELSTNIDRKEDDSGVVTEEHDHSNDMTKTELFALNKNQQVDLIYEITKDSVPKYEEARVNLLLELQEEGKDLRKILEELEN